MTEQERINESLQRQIDAQNARIDNTLIKVDMVMEEIRDIRADMREMNQRFYTKVDSLDKKIDDKFDRLSDQIHTMTIAAVVGFGAIAAAVGGLVFAAFK
ncbi:MAG: hypothetical protein IJL14_06600 [Selenomonadaceae bacterium]|nr:hypothetical protein [Selenomonadaceae bacterium]